MTGTEASIHVGIGGARSAGVRSLRRPLSATGSPVNPVVVATFAVAAVVVIIWLAIALVTVGPRAPSQIHPPDPAPAPVNVGP